MEELVSKLRTTHFSAWLQEYANVVCTVLDFGGKEPSRRVLHVSVDQNGCDQQDDRHGGCPICGGQHAATSCREFIGASPPGMWSMVRRYRLCFTCLRSGHTTGSCDVHGECQIKAADCITVCYMARTSSEDGRCSEVASGATTEETSSQQFSGVTRAGGLRHEVVTGTTRGASITLYGAGRQVDTYALLDEGSSVTMIDDELRRDLEVRGEHRQLNIQWFEGGASSNMVSMEISGAGKPTRHALRNVYSVSNLSLPIQTLGREMSRACIKMSQAAMTRRHKGSSKTPRWRWNTIIKDYVSKGYARKLQHDEVAVTTDGLWYSPHFGVENPNKPGKVRLMFDAAAKVGGTSLNLALDKGPQPYKRLSAVLFHFTKGAVGVCGDIKEMFHQVLILPEDRCSQRFLWRDGNDDGYPDAYEINVMTFGAACSPSAAHHGKTVNALKFRDSDPRAVKAIIDHHYVDDYVDSFATESEPISFSSSSPIVEAALGPPGQVKSVGWGGAELMILGMRWQVATDDFRFNVEYHRVPRSVLSGDRVPTKRKYLSLLMSTFDPSAKLMLREIWWQKIQWDEPLPEEIGQAFAAWRREMDAVGQFRCPRHYFEHGAVRTIELHGFVDASQSAFAAVAYWRVMYEVTTCWLTSCEQKRRARR
ncbi:uncharacterized protein LOC122818101 [Drosophila biarmipes]|uniref:uncharacterized protein LOC122818101 n=1 Tax=Drosophila biarmipes TaxID=125945 RepID=UPI0021CCE7A7|nr:uncharacterized protein LOC122818101 [Drosophila biarmipes]